MARILYYDPDSDDWVYADTIPNNQPTPEEVLNSLEPAEEVEF